MEGKQFGATLLGTQMEIGDIVIPLTMIVRNMSVKIIVVVQNKVKQHVQKNSHSVTKVVVGVEIPTFTEQHKIALLIISKQIVELDENPIDPNKLLLLND